jgi:hypothetical protein
MDKYSGRKFEGEYQLHPIGAFEAELSGAEDLGEREGPYGVKRQFRLSFVTDAKMSDGRNFSIPVWVNASLAKGKKIATLAAITEALNNDDINQRDLSKYDDEFEVVQADIGKRCTIMVTHKSGQDGNLRARVISYLPLGGKPVTTPTPKAPAKKSASADEKTRIAGIWAAADERAKVHGASKETVVREVYEALGIKGGTHEAAGPDWYDRVLSEIRQWVPNPFAESDDVPF